MKKVTKNIWLHIANGKFCYIIVTMYIRKSTRKYKERTYTNYLLVESVATEKGPRQKAICSLGDLKPRPAEEWLDLARKVESVLSGQRPLEPPQGEVEKIVEKARAKSNTSRDLHSTTILEDSQSELITVDVNRVEVEKPRSAGAVHVGHQMWTRLGLKDILLQRGLSERTCLLSEVMVMNRLIFPASEHAMPDWVSNTALQDILGIDLESLSEDSLYRNMDRLYPEREKIESELAQRERTLFNLEESIYLYDLTSTYFEGKALRNPKAKRGYSRDQRPDCKQLVVGLVLDGDGFPKCHEIFDGNRSDRTTVDDMLTALEKRIDKKPGATVIVDRGMAFAKNIQEIKAHNYHYLVTGLQPERNEWLAEFEKQEGWQQIIREPSPRNPFQKKTKVLVKRQEKDDELYVLCLSDGRKEKDRAIRLSHEKKLLVDMEKLKTRIQKGSLKDPGKIQQAIGRLKERYPRVARYHQIEFDSASRQIFTKELEDKKAVAEKLDGSYLLKTDRKDMTAEEIWKTYILLTRVEDAFRDMKSPLAERPVFHQIQRRCETHIFLCVLAYHLLVCIEKMFLDRHIHTSWHTIRQALSTHQVVTVVLPTSMGKVLRIRKGTAPEPLHQQIYDVLKIPHKVIKPVKTWSNPANSD